MKPLLVILLMLAVVLGYLAFTRKPPDLAAPKSTEPPKPAYWDEPLPAGVKLLGMGKRPQFDVVCERVQKGAQSIIEFHVTERHGYMVDGVRIEFWYREKDPDSGEWIEKPDTRVAYVCRSRLGFNETLTDHTVLLDMDYEGKGIDLAATQSENWKAEVNNWVRAMEPADG